MIIDDFNSYGHTVFAIIADINDLISIFKVIVLYTLQLSMSVILAHLLSHMLVIQSH